MRVGRCAYASRCEPRSRRWRVHDLCTSSRSSTAFWSGPVPGENNCPDPSLGFFSIHVFACFLFVIHCLLFSCCLFADARFGGRSFFEKNTFQIFKVLSSLATKHSDQHSHIQTQMYIYIDTYTIRFIATTYTNFANRVNFL